ncbi:MAG TPA: HlyD family efflux transporter periplasmic adaptor subunit [Chthonomonas sp.]|uniref:HlyD family secretion protein n=1 Tax=Chthonomonas sp. TaxID=2282153 RepID=UPI002B4B478B|nr:HlyD family efflux transporter periplasmic adaptor subunit [Chthonomonas sp.]HLI48375.1 HlyD family efflux transporter periplasmic adaptor subunit [Chthonomonas sp.]
MQSFVNRCRFLMPIALIGLLVTVLMACARQEMPTASKPAAAPELTPTSTTASTATKSLDQSIASKPEPLQLIGLIQTSDRATLSISQPTKALTVLVHNGDHVAAGQPLIVLDDTQTRAQWDQAEAGYRAAQDQLRKAIVGAKAQQLKADSDLHTAQAALQQAQQKEQQAQTALRAAQDANNADAVAATANVQKAKIELEQAQKNLRSLQQLASVGGVSQMQLQGAQAQVETAEADLRAAKAQLQQTMAAPGGSLPYRVALAQQDLDQAKFGVQQAQQAVQAAAKARLQVIAIAQHDVAAARDAVQQAHAALVAAKSVYRANQLISPIEGIVTDLAVHTGDIVQPGLPLLAVVSTNHPYVEALALARQLPLLHIGQAAKVFLDSHPGAAYAAKLTYISPVAEPDGRSFRVHFSFLHLPAGLRIGQSARILVMLP